MTLKIEDGVGHGQIIGVFECLYRPKRTRVYFGGRGSGKSWGIAEALLLRGVEFPVRVLCGRELQKSIDDSVHMLLVDTIKRLNLGNHYTITKSHITGKNGSLFRFSGIASNITSIKSSVYDILWLEEAENISDYSYDVIIPTFRSKGSEIILSFNPNDELDPTYTRYVTPYLEELDANGVYEDERTYVRKVNYNENPYFNDTELPAEMEKDKAENFKKYLHIWEGQPNADYSDSIIQPEWFNAAIGAHKKLGFEAKGIKSMGFDPADEGDDAKAVAFRHGVVVTDTFQWKDGDVADGVEKAFNYAYENRCDEFVYDGIGVGSAIKVYLRAHDPKGNMRVTNFIGSESPDFPATIYQDDRKNEDVFRNKRAQYWWLLRDRFERTYRAIEKGEYQDPDTLISIDPSLPNLAALRSELCRVQRKRGNFNSRIQVESKLDMRNRDMPSPNLADSLVYCFANPAPVTDNWTDGELAYEDLGII